jgi:hypothetical protein
MQPMLGIKIFLLVFAILVVASWLDPLADRLFPPGQDGISMARALMTVGIIVFAAAGMFITERRRERSRS